MSSCSPGGIGVGEEGVTQSSVTSLRSTVSTSTALKKATDWADRVRGVAARRGERPCLRQVADADAGGEHRAREQVADLQRERDVDGALGRAHVADLVVD